MKGYLTGLSLPTHWLTLHMLVVSLALLVYVFTAHTLRQRRSPSSAVAWVLFVVLLPYLALPAFLLFGSRKLARPLIVTTLPAQTLRGADHWVADTLAALGQPAPAAYRHLCVHSDGREAHESLLRTIDSARETLDLCTFILGRDACGQAVVDRLVAQVERGVRVRLLLDGMGSLMRRPPSLLRLMQLGGEVVTFVSPLRSPIRGRTNLRNHRKMLIADAGLSSERLWCGGRNLAAEYFEGSPGHEPWRDLSFELSGALVQQAGDLFERDWRFAAGLPAHAISLASSAATGSGNGGAQLVASGPDQSDDTLLALLVTATYRARERIVLASPYFVPDTSLLMALGLAARRGVVVDLLLPERSNHPLSDLARSRALRTLAQDGGRIWLAREMMHGKLAVFDDVLALSGSANLDSRSLLLNYELMVAFRLPSDVERFSCWFDRERASARPYVATPPGLSRDLAEGMLLWLAFQL